jgi:crotonobetainyl-CoA:carnitine CoA-transferase CaiB-like acyl-CoA transferase
MLAHYHRELTGEGQHIDQSCQQAIILTLMNAAEYWDLQEINIRGNGPGTLIPRPPPLGPRSGRSIYQCQDGYVLGGLGGGGQAGRVASTKALVEWANQDGHMLEFKDFDWSAVDAQTVTQEDIDHRAHLMQEFMITKTKAECLQRAVEHAIMLIPVSDTKDVLESPQMAYRGFFEQVEHPELGEDITYPGFPVMMNGSRPGVRRRAPLIGEHNEDIYEKELGISRKQLIPLKNRGVI